VSGRPLSLTTLQRQGSRDMQGHPVEPRTAAADGLTMRGQSPHAQSASDVARRTGPPAPGIATYQASRKRPEDLPARCSASA
jgi:hypothetical protein